MEFFNTRKIVISIFQSVYFLHFKDLGWISWKQEYPVWNVIAYEVDRGLVILNEIRSSIDRGHTLTQHQSIPPRAKTGRITRELACRLQGSHDVIYTALLDQLLRIQQLVQFMTACVEVCAQVIFLIFLFSSSVSLFPFSLHFVFSLFFYSHCFFVCVILSFVFFSLLCPR